MAKRRVRPLDDRVSAMKRKLKKMEMQSEVRKLQAQIKAAVGGN